MRTTASTSSTWILTGETTIQAERCGRITQGRTVIGKGFRRSINICTNGRGCSRSNFFLSQGFCTCRRTNWLLTVGPTPRTAFFVTKFCFGQFAPWLTSFSKQMRRDDPRSWEGKSHPPSPSGGVLEATAERLYFWPLSRLFPLGTSRLATKHCHYTVSHCY